VLVLFLVVEGYSFWAVVQVLADPRAPAPYGAVLSTHFGGTFLYWAFQFLVIGALTMRLVAEERRLGTWEALVTSPVETVSIVLGKWLGAVAFYAFLWVPTASYIAILYAFAPPGAVPDAGPILTAYLGVLLSGAAFLALGLLASALTESPVIALVLTFVVLLALLLVGLLPELAPGALARHPTVATLVAYANMRQHLGDLARGLVDLRHVGFYVGLTACALSATAAVLGLPLASRLQALRSLMGVALLCVAVILGNVLLAWHPRALDATRGRTHSLSDKTRHILDGVRVPTRALVLTAGAPEFVELYDEATHLLRLFSDRQPRIVVETLDPTSDPGRIGELAEAVRLDPVELAGGGAVVFLAGSRRRAVALLDMAEFAHPRREGQGTLAAFRGEEAFAAALLEVTSEVRPELCVTTGHGELGLDETPSGADLARVSSVLGADGIRPRTLDALAAGVPAGCAALAVVGPRSSLDAREALAVHEYLGRGGRLLLGVDGDLEVPTGLEVVLLDYGVRLAPAIVVDPDFEQGVPLAWATLTGYGQHPIAAPFRGRRETSWYAPRWVEAQGAPATTLVSSSAAGWAATDREGLRLRAGAPGARGDGDVAGPVSIAVAAEKGAGRIVVFGSARSFTSQAPGQRLSANALLFASAIAWLTGRSESLGLSPKTPEQFRVAMTAAQVETLFYACVLVLPGIAAALALLGLVARRRG
jgi:ABC-2 type transport system permease protein